MWEKDSIRNVSGEGRIRTGSMKRESAADAPGADGTENTKAQASLAGTQTLVRGLEVIDAVAAASLLFFTAVKSAGLISAIFE